MAEEAQAMQLEMLAAFGGTPAHSRSPHSSAHPPRGPVRAATSGRPPLLCPKVIVNDDGFKVEALGGNLAPGCVDVGPGLAVGKKPDGKYDYAALRKCMTDLKASVPDAARTTEVTVSFPPRTTMQDVMGLGDALAKTEDGHDLFPDVDFGVAH